MDRSNKIRIISLILMAVAVFMLAVAIIAGKWIMALNALLNITSLSLLILVIERK